ncbi:MAG: accessory gene regulator B family protein [Cellulosilyticaceae bacterium]
MKHFVADRIVASFIDNEVIRSEDEELYTYGLQQGFLMVLNIATTIIIGVAMGMLWESIIFMVAYIPFRSYAGGYHAKTQLRCYCVSVLLVAGALLGIRLITWTSFISLIVTLTSGIIIFFLAPVEDSNKPLDQIEVKVYKKRTRIIFFFEASMLIFLILLGQQQFATCIVMAIAVLSGMLILGKLKTIVQK